jgi:hypothetical protein
MLTDPVTLFDQAIRSLHEVSAVLHDEFDERIHPRPTEYARICREAHAQIQSLMPALKAARITQLPLEMRGQRPFCVDCD